MSTHRILSVYYAATLLFLLLDYAGGINLRVAFLDGYPGPKAGYYAVCCGLFLATLWRPAWSVAIATLESLVVLIGLIVSTALRVLVVTDTMLETGAGFVTLPQLVNFVISGTIAYAAWIRGSHELRRTHGTRP